MPARKTPKNWQAVLRHWTVSFQIGLAMLQPPGLTRLPWISGVQKDQDSLRVKSTDTHTFYIARVWNFYRISRLIVQSLLLHEIHLLPVSTEPPHIGTTRADIERSSTELVDDICASIPFLLGHDLSRMKLPGANSWSELESIGQTQSSCDKKDNSARRAGTFCLLWPLYIASSAPMIAGSPARVDTSAAATDHQG